MDHLNHRIESLTLDKQRTAQLEAELKQGNIAHDKTLVAAQQSHQQQLEEAQAGRQKLLKEAKAAHEQAVEVHKLEHLTCHHEHCLSLS